MLTLRPIIKKIEGNAYLLPLLYKYFSVFFMWFAFFMATTNAQTHYFENYSVKDGLAQSKVYCLLQDKQGYIWIGTENGASKFDGYNFINYTAKDGLAAKGIRSIYQAKNGILWFGHNDGGLSMFDGYKFSIFQTDTIKIKYDVTCIIEDNLQNIWISTVGDGLIQITNPEAANKRHFVQYKGAHGISDQIFSMLNTKNGLLYFVTNVGVKYFEPKTKTFEFIDIKNLPKYFQITCMFEDDKANLWFGTYHGGLYCYEKATDKVKIYDVRDGLAYNWISCIIQDSNGAIWLGTYGGGISKFENNQFINFNTNNGLPDLKVRCMYYDREGNIIIGTNESGLYVFKGEQFVSYTQHDGLPDNQVFSVLPRPEKKEIWLGTNNGIAVLSKNKEQYTYKLTYAENQGIADKHIRIIKKDQRNQIWIGTWGAGVMQFEEKTGRFKYNNLVNAFIPAIPQSPIIPVTALDIDTDNNLWIGTIDGLVYYEIVQQKIARLTQSDGLAGNSVTAIHCDKKGNVWVGSTGKGLTKIQGTTISPYLSQYDITPICITSDSKGILWVGTENVGVIGIVDDIPRIFLNIDNGLLSNYITLLLIENNYMYIGTHKGLNRYDINTHHIESYTYNAGFTGIEVRNNAAIKDSDNNLWFGTSNGAILLNKVFEKTLPRSPIALIKKFTANYNEKTIIEDLTLNYKERLVNIEYGSIYLTDHQSILYQTKLEGIDETWSQPTSETSVSYSYLPHGTYTFKVRLVNTANTLQSNEAMLHFTVKPPFWKTIWFYIVVSLLSLAVIFSYIKIRERNLIREKQILEQKVRERTAEIAQQKEEILAQRDHLEELNGELLQQKEEILAQRDEIEAKSEKLSQAYNIIEYKNKNITDSLKYAHLIQRSILPNTKMLSELAGESFILFKPKDIVSGDYYWFGRDRKKPHRIVFAAVDCTGHGVPGAFMSIVGIDIMNQALLEKHISKPSEILTFLHYNILETFQQKEYEHSAVKTGMDLVICAIDLKTNILEFAGSHNPLFLLRNGEIIQHKTDFYPLGMQHGDENVEFTNYEIPLEPDDIIYIFSDGFIDQFGGEQRKKIMKANFKKLLLSIQSMPLTEQKVYLENYFTTWKGELDQIDDVLVIGVKYNTKKSNK